MSHTIPVSRLDPFSDELLSEPYGFYRDLQSAGPVVWLEACEAFAILRFDDVRTALRDWRTFTSSEGIAFNDQTNQRVKQSIIGMDPPDHTAVRAVMTSWLRASEISQSESVARLAVRELLGTLVTRGTFEVISELAEPYVSRMVETVFGIPDSIIKLFIDGGGSANFMMVGPLNERAMTAAPLVVELDEAIGRLVMEDLRPGSVCWSVLGAEERNEIPEHMRSRLILNFVGAAFDTSINAIGNAVWLLARNPDQWANLLDDRSLIPSALNEVLRYESPIQAWSRYCRETTVIGESKIPGGSRVALMLGAANRDAHHYAAPDKFDVTRNPADHLGFGHGIHLCVGAPLARLELAMLLETLREMVTTMSIDGTPTRKINNTTRGLEKLTVTVSPQYREAGTQTGEGEAC